MFLVLCRIVSKKLGIYYLILNIYDFTTFTMKEAQFKKSLSNQYSKNPFLNARLGRKGNSSIYFVDFEESDEQRFTTYYLEDEKTNFEKEPLHFVGRIYFNHRDDIYLCVDSSGRKLKVRHSNLKNVNEKYDFQHLILKENKDGIFLRDKSNRKSGYYNYDILRLLNFYGPFQEPKNYCINKIDKKFMKSELFEIPETWLDIEKKDDEVILKGYKDIYSIVEDFDFRQYHKPCYLKIPEGVMQIANNAFDRFSRIDKSFYNPPLEDYYEIVKIDFPNSLWKIGDKAFYCCRYLWNLELPDTVRELGVSSFEKSIRTKLKLSNGLKEIPSLCFANLDLTMLEIPESVESICKDAFKGNYYLTSLRVTNNLKYVDENAFSDSNIVFVDYPDNPKEYLLKRFKTEIDIYDWYNNAIELE